MTSSNGDIFRVTGHLCGEFTGHRWIPCTKASDAELWCFLSSAPEKKNGWVNYGEAGDLRRHGAHYDVIVMDHQVDGITTAARTKHNLATTEVFFDDPQNECTYDWYDCIHDVRISIQFPTTTTQMRSIFTRILKPYCSVKD